MISHRYFYLAAMFSGKHCLIYEQAEILSVDSLPPELLSDIVGLVVQACSSFTISDCPVYGVVSCLCLLTDLVS